MTARKPAGNATREEVLAWMKENGAGYKRAAAYFDLPVDTVKTWGREEKGVGSRPRARATREARGEPEPPPKRRRAAADDEAPLTDAEVDSVLREELGEWDPTTATREEYLARAIRRCLARAAIAMRQDPPHGGVARQWEVTAGALRDDLDTLRSERAAAEIAAGRAGAALTSPAVLAARVLRMVPHLVRVAPEEAREIRDQLDRELGK